MCNVQRKDWLALVAVHSDSWLLALAFYKGARLNKEQRCVSVQAHVRLHMHATTRAHQQQQHWVLQLLLPTPFLSMAHFLLKAVSIRLIPTSEA